jgi:hypothetical protein
MVVSGQELARCAVNQDILIIMDAMGKRKFKFEFKNKGNINL